MPEPRYDETQRRTLLEIARASIEAGLRNAAPLAIDVEGHDAALRALRATFVSLRRNGDLRGCIGALEATRPLVADVARNAAAAAFRDPRFLPLTPEERVGLSIQVSVTSPLVPVPVAGEAELIESLKPGVDGLVLESGARRGTFLPAVWEQLPTPAEFVAALKQKSGLPGHGWSSSYRVHRYTTESFSDE